MTGLQSLGVLTAVALLGAFLCLRWRSKFLGSDWFDFLVPWSASSGEDGKARQEKRLEEDVRKVAEWSERADIQALERLEESLLALIDEDEDRRRNVESRLGTMVGLASIAATVVIGLVIAQVAGTLKISGGVERLIVCALALYVTVQLCDAICWALYGQERRNYDADTVDSFLPKPEDPEELRLKQRASELVKRLHLSQQNTDEKVTAMAVAHRAAKNFGVGLLVLGVVGLALIPAVSTTTPLSVEALKTDTQLQDLIRGRAGDQGPAGPPGPPGVVGPAGPKGDPGTPGRTTKTSGSQAKRTH